MKRGTKRGGWKGRGEGEEGGCGIDPLAENIPSRRPTFFHETRREKGRGKLGSIFASVTIVENRGWKKRALGVVSPSRDAAFVIRGEIAAEVTSQHGLFFRDIVFVFIARIFFRSRSLEHNASFFAAISLKDVSREKETVRFADRIFFREDKTVLPPVSILF